MFLSIVVPFYNRDISSLSLLNTLCELDHDGLEVILVDDGSTNDTYNRLKELKNTHTNKNIEVYKQKNKGPGGARNTGLKKAKGKYVWFVDSDDNINSDAIKFVKTNSIHNYDVINFNYSRKGTVYSGIDISVGFYTIEEHVRKTFLKGFGPLWSNIYRRKMLIDNKIFYPEHCYYEDNPLVFIYPFFVKSFIKSNIVAYKYNEENNSIVRSKPNPRTLDRLHTAEYGFQEGLKHVTSQSEIDILAKEFIRLYLLNSVGIYMTKSPGRQWLTAWRIMKSYRKKAKKFNINSNIFQIIQLSDSNMKYKCFLYAHWLISHSLYDDQDKFFHETRKAAWNLKSSIIKNIH